LALAFLPACAAAAPALAQEQANGVDNSKMGTYRALAQHLYAEKQTPDPAKVRAAFNAYLDKLKVAD